VNSLTEAVLNANIFMLVMVNRPLLETGEFFNNLLV